MKSISNQHRGSLEVEVGKYSSKFMDEMRHNSAELLRFTKELVQVGKYYAREFGEKFQESEVYQRASEAYSSLIADGEKAHQNFRTKASRNLTKAKRFYLKQKRDFGKAVEDSLQDYIIGLQLLKENHPEAFNTIKSAYEKTGAKDIFETSVAATALASYLFVQVAKGKLTKRGAAYGSLALNVVPVVVMADKVIGTHTLEEALRSCSYGFVEEINPKDIDPRNGVRYKGDTIVQLNGYCDPQGKFDELVKALGGKEATHIRFLKNINSSPNNVSVVISGKNAKNNKIHTTLMPDIFDIIAEIYSPKFAEELVDKIHPEIENYGELLLTDYMIKQRVSTKIAADALLLDAKEKTKNSGNSYFSGNDVYEKKQKLFDRIRRLTNYESLGVAKELRKVVNHFDIYGINSMDELKEFYSKLVVALGSNTEQLEKKFSGVRGFSERFTELGKYLRISLEGGSRDRYFLRGVVEGSIPIYDKDGKIVKVQVGVRPELVDGAGKVETRIGPILAYILSENSFIEFGAVWEHLMKFDSYRNLSHDQVEVVLNYYSGRNRISANIGIPFSGGKRVKTETRVDKTSSISFTDTQKIQTVEQLTTTRETFETALMYTKISLYRQLVDWLGVEGGFFWKDGRMDLRPEYAGIFELVLNPTPYLEIRPRVKLGTEKPEYAVGFRYTTGWGFRKFGKDKGFIRDPRGPVDLEGVLTGRFHKEKKEAKTLTGVLNNFPDTPTVTLSQTSPKIKVEWTYSDKDGDPQSGADIIINGGIYNDHEITIAGSSTTFTLQDNIQRGKTYTIKVRVKDDRGGRSGLSNPKSITITSTNQNPTVTIDSPSSDQIILAGQSVTFESTASDPDGDTLTHDWTITVSTGGPAPSISDVEDPGSVTFTNTGIYLVKDTVDDGRGGTDETVERKITILAGGPGG